MGCCAGKGRVNTYYSNSRNRVSTNNKVAITNVVSNKCAITRKDLADLYTQTRKSNLNKGMKQALKAELAVMSQLIQKQCPDTNKIEAIKKALEEDGTNTDIQ